MLKKYKGQASILLILVLTFYVATLYNSCGRVQFSPAPLTAAEMASRIPGITINNGAEFTKSKSVELTLHYGLAKEMWISNDPTCSTGHWEPFVSKKSWNITNANQSVSVFVKFQDSEGVETPCINDDIIHDDIPPQIAFVNPNNAVTNQSAIKINFTVNDSGSGAGASTCQDFLSANPQTCAGLRDLINVPEGLQQLIVRAQDKAGNEAAPAVYTWTVDMTPPQITLNGAPAAVTAEINATFNFTVIDSGAGIDKIECQIDNSGNWQTCASPKMYSGLSEGNHTWQVRAKDKAGNLSSPVSHNWRIDKTAPTVQITQMPPAFTNSGSATFAFVGSDDGQPINQFECNIDGAGYSSCSPPKNYSGLLSGSHQFQVRSIDNTGNRSAPASYSWMIDTTAPVITLVQKPAAQTAQTSALFTWSVVDNESGVALVECKWDSGAYAACNSNSQSIAGLVDGPHKFYVRAMDRAGNISPETTYTWNVDTQAPALQFTQMPAQFTNQTSAHFEYVANDGAGSGVSLIECKLLSEGVYGPCPSPKDYTGLGEGQKTFMIRAIDQVGNISAALAYTWTIDLTPPEVIFVNYPTSVPIGSPAVIQYQTQDSLSGIQSNQCGLVGNLTNCAAQAQVTLNNLSLGLKTYRVTAVDKAGNLASGDITFNVTVQIVAKTQNLTITDSNKADILVVIDNSGSMEYEQTNMSQRINGFIDKLVGLEWQIGIITTDVSVDLPLMDGRLIALEQMNGNQRQTANRYLIDSTLDPALAQNILGTSIQRPEVGSGLEQGIHASYRAITRAFATTNLSVNAPNRALFRDDSALAIVVISDEDETLTVGNKNLPSQLIDLVNQQWAGQKNFTFHSIITKPDDFTCLTTNGKTFGLTYNTLSQLTGGIVGSVCATDYAAQLANIGQNIRDFKKTVNLSCIPVDLNGDGTPELSILKDGQPFSAPYSISNLKLTFNNYLPPGQYVFNYNCPAP